MNTKWKKGERRRASASVPEAIECDGSELCMVLAKLRRQGRTPGEPQRIAPNRWRIVPGAPTRKFIEDPNGNLDHAYSFGSWSQGMSGALDY